MTCLNSNVPTGRPDCSISNSKFHRRQLAQEQIDLGALERQRRQQSEHACIITKTRDDFTLKQGLLIWTGTVAFEFDAEEIAQPAQFCNCRQLAEFRVQVL